MPSFKLSQRHTAESAIARRSKRRIAADIPPFTATDTKPLNESLVRDKRILQLLSRDGDRCYICGIKQEPTAYEIDHIIPQAHGGTNTLSNLALACKTCNGRKSDYVISVRIVDKIPYFQSPTR